MTSTLNFELSNRPDFGTLTVQLEQGQQIFAETSAMASMDANVNLKSGLKGGIGQSLMRGIAGDSMIVNTFTAENGEGEVVLAPGPPGDMLHYQLTGNNLMLQRGAFVAHSDHVEISGKWEGAKGFFSGQGLVLLKASGTGDVFFNSYGAIIEVEVNNDYIVDTGYIVAFEDTLTYKVSVLPGLSLRSKIKSLFFGGEGLVCKFQGQGKVWIQTRNVNPFLNWINLFRPTNDSK